MLRPILLLLVLGGLTGCVQPSSTATNAVSPPGEPPGALPVASLPGWAAVDPSGALAAFVRGCKAIQLMPPDQSLGGAGLAQQLGGQAGQWQAPCAAAQNIPPNDIEGARSFFETSFFAIAVPGAARISGYFEPQYRGSKNYAPGYTVPLYAKPADPVLANLPRAAIDHNALYRKAPVTAYLTNPVDAFMLQIYGAGRILLPDGRILRVGFDGQNSEPYTPIGQILVADGDLAPDDVNFQSISSWLKSHPREAGPLMEENARYVYLKPLGDLPDDEGAPGALGVPLTAGSSLAVDNSANPLGMPIFLSASPASPGPAQVRLAVTQDADAGIHGPNAVKIFFGSGPEAEAAAGAMPQSGRLYLLLPRPAPTT